MLHAYYCVCVWLCDGEAFLLLSHCCSRNTYSNEAQFVAFMLYYLFKWVLLSCVHAIASNQPQSHAKYGKAVIVMSAGRGGSTWFCDIVKHTSPMNSADLSFELFGHG